MGFHSRFDKLLKNDLSARQRKKDVDEIKVHEAEVKRRLRQIMLTLIAAWIISGVATARGFFLTAEASGGTDFDSLLFATMQSIVSALLLGVASGILLKMSMELGNLAKSGIGLWIRFCFLSLLLIPFIAAVSTVNAIYGTSAPAAMSFDLRHSAERWRSYVETSINEGNKADSAVQAIQPLERSVCQMADSERTSGILTGSPGRGALSAAYQSACSQIGSILGTLSQISASQSERRSELALLLEELRATARDSELSIFDRRERFEVITSQIQALLSENRSVRITETLGAQLANLRASVSAVQVNAGEFGNRQASAIQALQTYFATIETSVGELVSDETPETEAGKPPALLSMGSAVWTYRHRLWPGIMLACGLDAFIGWYGFALALSASILKARKRTLHDAPEWLDLPFIDLPHGNKDSDKTKRKKSKSESEES